MKRLLILALLTMGCATAAEKAENRLRVRLVELEDPVSVLSDETFAEWTEHPVTRAALRAALPQYAKAEPLVMVRPSEPGEPLVLEARVVDESDGRGLAGVLIEIVHADADGVYFPETDSLYNPRLFGIVRTSEQGGLRIETIRPGGYEDDDGELVAAHLHFNAEAEGYRPFGGEIVLADDPVFTPEARAEAVREGSVIVQPSRGANGAWRVRATIPMQRLPD